MIPDSNYYDIPQCEYLLLKETLKNPIVTYIGYMEITFKKWVTIVPPIISSLSVCFFKYNNKKASSKYTDTFGLSDIFRVALRRQRGACATSRTDAVHRL